MSSSLKTIVSTKAFQSHECLVAIMSSSNETYSVNRAVFSLDMRMFYYTIVLVDKLHEQRNTGRIYRLTDHYGLGLELEIPEDYKLLRKTLITIDPLFSMPCSFLNKFEAIVRDTSIPLSREFTNEQPPHGRLKMNAEWVSAILAKVRDHLQPEISIRKRSQSNQSVPSQSRSTTHNSRIIRISQ